MSGVIRTDLAMEARELHPELAGVEEENFVRDGVQVSRISITTPEAAEKLGKRMGLYITIDAPELPLKPTGLTDAVSRELARQIVTLMGDAAPDAPVLVAGLGNRAVTPDSLGPRVADAIYVTRHIKQYMAEAVPETVREVSALAPGVLGVTGVETREIIYGVVEHTKPAFIIAVDSLASRRAARI
nr:GPR endopeptidase [Clostridia bacterium]